MVCPSVEVFPATCPDTTLAVSECPGVVREELALLRREHTAERDELRRKRATEQEGRSADTVVFNAAVAGWIFNVIIVLGTCCRRNALVRREGRRHRGGGVLD